MSIPPDPLPDDPSVTDAPAVAAALGTDPARGLSTHEAATRLQQHGANALRRLPAAPFWRRALAQFLDPLVLLLLGAIAIAGVAWWMAGGAGWPLDAMVIAAVVLLNAGLGLGQESKALSAVAALARLTAARSTVLRGGQVLQVLSADLVAGDVLVLAEGDAVGADARLLQCSGLQVQEASLTGESEAVRKDAATLAAPAALADRLNMVYKGTAVAQGAGRALVVATGMATELGRIAHLLDATVEPPTPLQQEVARLGRWLGLAVLLIAAVVVATLLLLLAPVHSLAGAVPVLLLGVSLAVAAVPEGLPAILSVVLALGVQRLARQHAVVKQLSSVETLGSATVIASDKTGTLTRAEMTLQRVVTLSGITQITGVGYAPIGQAQPFGTLDVGAAALPAGDQRDELDLLLRSGCLAGNASLRQDASGAWLIHGDPTEAAFLVAERKLGGTERREQRFQRRGEIGFSAERKMMSVIVSDADHAGALQLVTKGAPGAVLACCSRVRQGRQDLPLDDARRARLLAAAGTMADDSLRTLAVACRPLAAGEGPPASDDAATAAPAQAHALEQGLVLIGLVGLIDPPRAEAAVAIAQARSAGIRVIMITGDHPRTAARIAADLGLVAAPADAGACVLTGAQLDALDAAGLAAAVRSTSVYARVAPAHKLRIVAALQADGQVVAMTGDGVNDAPALKAADIGIAMGVTGSEVTKQAARLILADDNFATIVRAVEEGRGVFDNLRKCLRYLLTSNMGEVLTVFLGVVGSGLFGLHGGAAGGAVVLPLLATQLLWINLVTDSAPALALGVDPPVGDLMARPPRRRDERLIDARMWRDVAEIGLVSALLTLLTIDHYLPGGLLAGDQSLDTARTAGFTVLVLASLFNCLIARSDTASAFRQLFANRWLWAAMALSAALQVAVVHLGWLNLAFGSVPLTLSQWAMCVAMASGVLWFSELRKAFSRWLAGRATPAPTPAA